MLSRSESSISPASRSYLFNPRPTVSDDDLDKFLDKPGVGERFPVTRYTTNPYSTSYYTYAPGTAVLDSKSFHRYHYTQRDRPPLDFLESNLNVYYSKLALAPAYGAGLRLSERSEHLDVDRAVEDYKQRRYILATSPVAPQAKYWMTPRYWQSNREKSRQRAHNWATR